MTMTAAADGTSQRSAGLDLNTDTMSTSRSLPPSVRRERCDSAERFPEGWPLTCKGSPVRLLVVEDEARLAAALQRGLQAEGFAVDVAGDGQDGLEMARHGGYDAMILDVMLPRLSGYRIVRQLRAERNWVPVLMLSAKDGEYDQADGLDCGADDYLTKPFSYIVLLARLRALLRRGAHERPPVLCHGDIELDPAERRVLVAGDQVVLTTREFALLEYLMRRPG